MKLRLIFPSFLLILIWQCQSGPSDSESNGQEYSETPTEPKLLGNAVDSVFLFVDYMDPGVSRHEKEGCEFEPLKSHDVLTKGKVDSRIPGVYVLNYSFPDDENYKHSVLSRTVHVVENSSTFLNGTYKVSCTCTAVAQGLSSATLTSGQYTAMISSSNHRDEFNLSNLKIGPISVSTKPMLIGDSLALDYFSPDYHQMAQFSGSGNLIRAENVFTLRTRVMPYDTKVMYTCINSYTRQLVIDKE